MKQCAGCKNTLAEDEFYWVRAKGRKPYRNSRCKPCIALKDRLPRNRWSRAPALAKRDGLKWSILFEPYELLLGLGCIYCRASLMDSTGISLDRIDPMGHYTADNVHPCCWTCNYIKKRIFTHEEMLEIAPLIIRFNERRRASGLPLLAPPERGSAREGKPTMRLKKFRDKLMEESEP
jgi:hypothetical protein